MYGDTDVMRRRVAQLREQGVDIRAMAERLVARTDSIGWTGRAADAMRERIRDRAAHLREAAAHHDTAADSLEKHLQEVDRLKDSIAGVERRATRLVVDAQTRVARAGDARHHEAPDDSGVTVTADPADQTLAAFAPPPAGHKDWLTVSLPGL